MAINISVRYNGGLLPDIILLTQGYYHRGIRFKYHVKALSLQSMKQYIIATILDVVLLYIVSVLLLLLVWCPCMSINVSVQHNGGLLPNIITLLTK